MSDQAHLFSEAGSFSLRERFEAYISQTFAQEIGSWDEATRADIYALSFFIYDHDDDPREPMVHLGYNTESYWRAQIPRASDALEAKWNFAFWSQEFKAVIATPDGEHWVDPDPEGIALRDAWLASEGLDYSDERPDIPPPSHRTLVQSFELMEQWQDVTQAFVALCVRVSHRLHESGVITVAFGHTIPIIIHELEYYRQIADQTRAANPPGSTQEFDDWVASLYE